MRALFDLRLNYAGFDGNKQPASSSPGIQPASCYQLTPVGITNTPIVRGASVRIFIVFPEMLAMVSTYAALSSLTKLFQDAV
ncbi:hypothetical protein J6590_046726 [Homalodisca vitripennis]|nr:hypothetical protein J6590_046726 [Homalodisca vitripennis]